MLHRRPSLKDVAELAGVSTATVSNVFSQSKPVNSKLAANVRKAADKLGYSIDRAAAQLRTGRTRIVAVLVPDLTDTFFATIVSSLETMAYRHGYDVIVASSKNDPDVEKSRLRALLSWKPAGLIFNPCSDIIPAEARQRANDLPTVLIDRVCASETMADTVTLDNADAGRIAARHLLAMGHRNILIGISQREFAPLAGRIAGAVDMISQYSDARGILLEMGADIEVGKQRFTAWLERNPIPDAVIALTNITTLGVLSALAEHRIDIPNKISVVAFDDYAWMAARNTGLTAIRQPVQDMAEAAWKRLLLRMEAKDEVPVTPIVLRGSLIVRASVKNLSGAVPDMQGSAWPKPDSLPHSTEPKMQPSSKGNLLH